MPVQATQFSPSASLVNATQNLFAVGKNDGAIKYSAKVAGRILPNAALTIASMVETVVLAILTAVTFLPSYISSRPYDACKAGTALAGRATKEAFFGIAGYSTPEVKTPASPSLGQKAKNGARAVLNGGRILGRFAMDHKGKIGLAIVTLAAIYFAKGRVFAKNTASPSCVMNGTNTSVPCAPGFIRV